MGILVHPDAEVLKHDVAKIRQMETDMTLFEFQEATVEIGRPANRSRAGTEMSRGGRSRVGSMYSRRGSPGMAPSSPPLLPTLHAELAMLEEQHDAEISQRTALIGAVAIATS